MNTLNHKNRRSSTNGSNRDGRRGVGGNNSPDCRPTRGSVETYRSNDGKSGQRQTIIPPIDWAFRRQADHFIACVRNGVEPVSRGRDTIYDMRLMEAIFRTMILVNAGAKCAVY